MRPFRTLHGLLLAALLAGPLGAQESDELTGTLDLGYASQRVFRGVERAGPSAQVAGEAGMNGFRGGFWANQPLAGGPGGEVDLDGAYTWRSAGGVGLELSATNDWFLVAPAGGTRRTWEAGASILLPAMDGWMPSVAYFRDFRRSADTAEVAVARRVALTGLGAFLHFNFFAGWSHGEDWRPDAPGPRRRDGYGYWGAEANLPFRIGAHATLVGGLDFSNTFGRSAANGPDGRSTGANLGFTLGVNLDF